MLFSSPIPPSGLPPSTISVTSAKSSKRSMKKNQSRSPREKEQSKPDETTWLIDDSESKRSYVDSWVESQSESSSRSSSSTTDSGKKRRKWHPKNVLKATGKFLINGLILTYGSCGQFPPLDWEKCFEHFLDAAGAVYYPLYKDMDPDVMLLHIY